MSVCLRIIITCCAICVLTPVAECQSTGSRVVVSLPRGTANLVKKMPVELKVPEAVSQGFSTQVAPANAAERQQTFEWELSGDAVATFRDACHFPAELGTAAPGVVIYEGMQLALQSNGDYGVSFFAEIPRSCVTVRLRFVVWGVESGEFVRLGSINVAPVVLKSSSLLSSQFGSETVRVQASGNSAAIPELLKSNQRVVVRRSGTARFGMVPERGVSSFGPVAEKTAD